MRRKTTIFTAWVVGWVLYLGSGVLYEFPAILIQPIIGTVFSAICVGIVCLIGRAVFSKEFFSRPWQSNGWWARGLVGIALFLLFFGRSLGLSGEYIVYDGVREYREMRLHP